MVSSSEFDDFMKDNKYTHRACGKIEAMKYLVCTSALRGQVSELLDNENLSERVLGHIASQSYKDAKPIYGETPMRVRRRL